MTPHQPGYGPDHVEIFHTASLKGQLTPLELHIYRGQSDVGSKGLVWFHAGGFRTGRIAHSAHRVMARWLVPHGITLIVPAYRLGATSDDLSKKSRKLSDRLSQSAISGFPDRLRGSAAFAALEDAEAALDWIARHRRQYELEDKVMIGGSSAGGITVLNLMLLRRDRCHGIAGGIVLSGGFGFASDNTTEVPPTMAIHNPNDQRVPIDSIRSLDKTLAGLTLHEAPNQDHGDFRLTPTEPKRIAFRRLLDHIERCNDRSGQEQGVIKPTP